MTPIRIRMKEAPCLLGMTPTAFNTVMRPYLVATQVGKQDIGFDFDELKSLHRDFHSFAKSHARKTSKGWKFDDMEAWHSYMRTRRLSRSDSQSGEEAWPRKRLDPKGSPDSYAAAASTTSIRSSRDSDPYARARTRLVGKQQSGS